MNDRRPIAVDTNIFVYAEGIALPDESDAKLERARLVIKTLFTTCGISLPVQVLGELLNVLTRKGRWPRERAVPFIAALSAQVTRLPTDAECFADALELVGRHQFAIWDAIILAAAARAGCSLLLTEDMQDGFVWHGTTVANPFAASPHPLLASLLPIL